jgi:hypothetical protein
MLQHLVDVEEEDAKPLPILFTRQCLHRVVFAEPSGATSAARGHRRRGLELRPLDDLKAVQQRFFVVQWMLPRGRRASLLDLHAGLDWQRRDLAAQEAAFHIVNPAMLDFALILGRVAGRQGVSRKPKCLAQSR